MREILEDEPNWRDILSTARLSRCRAQDGSYSTHSLHRLRRFGWSCRPCHQRGEAGRPGRSGSISSASRIASEVGAARRFHHCQLPIPSGFERSQAVPLSRGCVKPARERASGPASQAEGRGFEPHRPLSVTPRSGRAFFYAFSRCTQLLPADGLAADVRGWVAGVVPLPLWPSTPAADAGFAGVGFPPPWSTRHRSKSSWPAKGAELRSASR